MKLEKGLESLLSRILSALGFKQFFNIIVKLEISGPDFKSFFSILHLRKNYIHECVFSSFTGVIDIIWNTLLETHINEALCSIEIGDFVNIE